MRKGYWPVAKSQTRGLTTPCFQYAYKIWSMIIFLSVRNWYVFFLRAGTVGKTITISRRSQGTIFSVSLWNFDNTILIRLPICFELRITVVNVICNCVCHRTIQVPAADHSKHPRIANYREQLSVLWQFGCLSLSIHKIKKKNYRSKHKSTPVRLLEMNPKI